MYFHLYCKLRCFWRNLHCWQKFYTAAGSDSIDKSHLWLVHAWISNTIELRISLTHHIALQADRRGVGAAVEGGLGVEAPVARHPDQQQAWQGVRAHSGAVCQGELQEGAASWGRWDYQAEDVDTFCR